MPKNIRVIEQGSGPDSPASYHVNARLASVLVEAGQCSWVVAGQVIRKTHQFGRVESDSKVLAGRPFALRGLSCEVGGELARAVRADDSRDWALPMLAAIKMRLEVPNGTLSD